MLAHYKPGMAEDVQFVPKDESQQGKDSKRDSSEDQTDQSNLYVSLLNFRQMVGLTQ